MVTIDLDKAKQIVHEKRRVVREKEFIPLDKQINIPGLSESAENQRVEIRERYKKIQEQIDSSTITVDRLKTIYKKLEI